MLLLIPRVFKHRDVPRVLQAKPNPCVNGLRAASRISHCIAPCLGQSSLGFPDSSVPFLAFTDVSSSEKICQEYAPPLSYFSRKVGYKHTDCLLMLALAGLSSWAGFGEIASCAPALISLWLRAPSRQESSPKHLCPACASLRRRGCSPRRAGGIFLGEFQVRQHLWVHCSHQLSSVQCVQPAGSSWSCWEIDR